jgi:hypothetical protein
MAKPGQSFHGDGGHVAEEQDEVDVRFITAVFGSLILAAATQGKLAPSAIQTSADAL